MDKLRVEQVNNISPESIIQLNELLDDDTEWDTEQGDKFLRNPDNALFLSFFENNVVGFLTAHRLQRIDNRNAEVLIYELSVSPGFRRKGIGKSLINSVKDWAKKVGADEVWVLTNKSNEAAMELYKSMGGTIENTDEQMYTFKI